MDIVMPSLGADMEEGTLNAWLVKEGDEVKAGDIIAVIETNKGAIDMEVFDDGVISQLCLQPVVTVPVGAVMATMTLDSETETETEIKLELDIGVERTTENRVSASPAARVLAQREHINLSSVEGTGPHDAVLLRDLYLAQAHRKPHAKTVVPSADQPVTDTAINDTEKMRSAIAMIMERSKREIPHYYLSSDIDISKAKSFIDTTNADREPEHRVLLLALLLRAIAKVLPMYPQLNGYYQQGQFSANNNIHIGNAITLRGGGLVVPAIHHVEQLSLDQAMAALRDVIARSRSGHLRSSELTDATITVSNIGDRGADAVFAVIYPPQVAIIGIGKPQQKALVIDGEIKACLTITVTLSADHRVSDGFIGAKFLHALDAQLQQPEQL